MKNQEISKIFYEMANFFETDKVDFRSIAYRKAASFLEAMEEDVLDIYKKGGIKALLEIPGIGKGLSEKIEEYLKTGKIKTHQRLKKELPIALQEIINIEGVGPKRAKILYQKIGVKSVKELEKAAKEHKVSPLFGFGDTSEKNILQGIAFLKRDKGRVLLGEILPKAREVYEKLKRLKGVEEVDLAGSLRRRKETIGDIDFLVVVKGAKGSASAKASADAVADFFVSLPGVEKVWGKGGTKASVRMKDGYDMDVRVLPKKSYGAGLQYFTGSKEHNIILRKIAIDKGLKLSEYGIFKGPKMLATETEEKIYKTLGMNWIDPELRENQGEVEASLNHKLPKIIGYNDIKGDLHTHSDWDGGENSIEEMAKAAMEMGYEYIGISDHTKFLRIERGLDEKKLRERNREIDKINETLRLRSGQNFTILKGCECNILNDGKVDIKDEVLAEMDYVIAGIHSSFKMEKNKMTERMIRAMRNPNIDIISHPTGRLIKKRDEYQIDFEKILKAAKETGTILEINAHPLRLDLNDQKIRQAKEMGVKMVINTDAHHKDQLNLMEFGISQARRGWAEKEDIINCWPLDKLLRYFKK